MVVLLPTRAAAPAFAHALVEATSAPVLRLPRLTTLADWAASVPVSRPLWTDSARELALVAQLRGRGWFDDADLWAVAAELRQLADDLTRHHAVLPTTVDDFTARLELAYRQRAGAPMEMEARLVHESWRAMTGDGEEVIDAVTRHHLQLAKLAASAAAPLVAVGLDRLSAAEAEFLAAYDMRQPVLVISGGPAVAGADPVVQVLAAAWPARGAEGRSLRERALAAASADPLRERIALFGASSFEEEAQAADVRIRSWLLAGKERIAVVVHDRLVARRLRALLERAGVLVQDEAGWALSTVAAATVIMRFLDCLGSDFHHRDLVDLLKSPFLFGQWSVDARRSAAYNVERIIRREGVISGLGNFIEAAAGGDEAGHARAALECLQGGALRMFARRHATVGGWLERLNQALDVLGVAQALARDAAGQQLLDLLARMARELKDSGPRFDFGAWRRWLDGELERATFRDRDVTSPVLFTHLAATALREFDGVILLGCDARQFPAGAGATLFFNQSVRRELGLPTREDELEDVRRQLLALVAATPEVFVTWQAQVDDEPNLVSPYFARLEAFSELAFGHGLRTAPSSILPAARVAGATQDSALPEVAGPPAPAAADLVPPQVSVSAWASLVACPYQFYARHLLKLNELDEVREEIEKRDYGELVHAVLQRFHGRHARVSTADRGELAQELAAISDEVFAPLLARNYLAVGWLTRWRVLIPAYLDWQAAREADGWQFAAGEQTRQVVLTLAGGGSVTLRGRLDRIDQRATAEGLECAVLDYKTQSVEVLRRKVRDAGEDVQLAAYALLQEGVADAAYVSLDKGKVAAVPPEGDPAVLAADDRQRMVRAFSGLVGGARLPAHGDLSTCRWCEMRALCRRDHWT
ncbi:MAG: PD-(D/E)XK nuclease family protein [Betaproteobacteria bacterium]|nr:PD-(D/E)XK nuclease family protein [Betaproteobacteria bacterium]